VSLICKIDYSLQMAKREKKFPGETRTINGGRGEIVIYQPGEGGGLLELRRTMASPQLTTDMSRGLVEVIARCTQTFLWLQRYDVDFLNRNSRLFLPSGEAIINDIGLAALALLTAESNPRYKDVMIRLTMNMLTGER